MKFLLFILVVGSHSESLTTEPFSDYKSCMNAGIEAKEWIENNDARIGGVVSITCLKVTGK